MPVILTEITVQPTLAETVENVLNIIIGTSKTYPDCHIHITPSKYCTTKTGDKQGNTHKALPLLVKPRE